MDTKDTKELIKALNPKYELKASIQKEKEFIEARELAKNNRKKSIFQRGVNYLKNKGKGTKKNIKPNSSYKPLTTSRRSKVSNVLPK
jgi:hypothetical protein